MRLPIKSAMTNRNVITNQNVMTNRNVRTNQNVIPDLIGDLYIDYE